MLDSPHPAWPNMLDLPHYSWDPQIFLGQGPKHCLRPRSSMVRVVLPMFPASSPFRFVSEVWRQYNLFFHCSIEPPSGFLPTNSSTSNVHEQRDQWNVLRVMEFELFFELSVYPHCWKFREISFVVSFALLFRVAKDQFYLAKKLTLRNIAEIYIVMQNVQIRTRY